MKALYAGESETRVRAGRVLVSMRYATDREVVFVCSPEGARFFAAQLLAAAVDAEATELEMRQDREAREQGAAPASEDATPPVGRSKRRAPAPKGEGER